MIARFLRWFRRDGLADLCMPDAPRTLDQLRTRGP